MLVSGILLWRKTYRQLPFFFIYVLSAWLFGVVRYAAFLFGPQPYFYVYWISELAGAVTVSLALYEVFLRRLFMRFYKIRFYRNLFPAIAVLIFLLTIVTVLEKSDRRAAFLVASRGFDFARTSVLVFFVALMALMGREWKRYDFGIAVGFGLQAAVALVNAAVRTQVHNKSTILDSIEAVALDLACIIWLITFSRPQESVAPTDSREITAETLHEARKWEHTLKDFITPGKR
ncbi:MAG TPA: hypothetical protein VFT65_10930 [Candidatus Angelobacter sp.]|nr:hypothetical protein [Candidatus Angelobacter sp.]